MRDREVNVHALDAVRISIATSTLCPSEVLRLACRDAHALSEETVEDKTTCAECPAPVA
jgi:hypothetical protein